MQVTEIPLEPSPHQLRVSRSLARLLTIIIFLTTIIFLIILTITTIVIILTAFTIIAKIQG